MKTARTLMILLVSALLVLTPSAAWASSKWSGTITRVDASGLTIDKKHNHQFGAYRKVHLMQEGMGEMMWMEAQPQLVAGRSKIVISVRKKCTAWIFCSTEITKVALYP